MSREAEAIDASATPATPATLLRDLRTLGVADGDVMIVHTSLSALGWVAGGAQAVVEALLAAVGPGGTLVMATQSGQLSDPADWSNPPVPAAWIPALHDGLPAYDPHLTPTRGMGAVVECFRTHPATVRSAHPLVSFAANGPAAEEVVASHPLTPSLGDGSPLGRLYDLHAHVLLLGVGHGSNTSLHLAEHRGRWPGKADVRQGAPMLVDGRRAWVPYRDLDLDDGDFDAIGAVYEQAAPPGTWQQGPVGAGIGRRYPMPALVDHATAWISDHRA